MAEYTSKYTGAEIDAGIEKALAGGMVGPPGPAGTPGKDGAPGPKGDPGAGFPPGGTAGQVLKKLSDVDYATEWADLDAGVTEEQMNAAIQAAILDSWEGSY